MAMQGRHAAPLADRCHDVSGELLDLEQLDDEIVEGVVPFVQPRAELGGRGRVTLTTHCRRTLA
jgi:hypothetical protein